MIEEEKKPQSMHAWQGKISEQYFDDKVKEILQDRNQPASISQLTLLDEIVERHPELAEKFTEKTIKACIFKSMGHQDPPYLTISKRKKCFWRADLV